MQVVLLLLALPNCAARSTVIWLGVLLPVAQSNKNIKGKLHLIFCRVVHIKIIIHKTKRSEEIITFPHPNALWSNLQCISLFFFNFIFAIFYFFSSFPFFFFFFSVYFFYQNYFFFLPTFLFFLFFFQSYLRWFYFLNIELVKNFSL